MLYEFGGFALKDKFAPVWERDGAAGLRARLARRVPGDRSPRACARRAAPSRIARLAARAVGSRPTASPATSPPALERLWDKIAGQPAARQGRDHLRRDRRRARDRRGARLPRRASRTLPSAPPAPISAMAFEPQFPMNVALAALALQPW